MRSRLSFRTAAILLGALFPIAQVTANPDGVPVSESPPLVCNTPNFTVTAQTGSAGEFPKAAVCNGNPCSEYGYTITSPLNISHTIFGVSATQNLVATDPASFVAAVGAGDSLTGFLALAVHEYSVRFNANGTVYNAKIFVDKGSKARIGPALMRAGNKVVESCLIATPGIAVDASAPVFTSSTVKLANGHCTAILSYDAAGNVVGGTSPDCPVTRPAKLFVGGQEITNNSAGITIGNTSCTCYGPSIPNPPICFGTTCPTK